MNNATRQWLQRKCDTLILLFQTAQRFAGGFKLTDGVSEAAQMLISGTEWDICKDRKLHQVFVFN